jgi:adenylate cyclase class IV
MPRNIEIKARLHAGIEALVPLAQAVAGDAPTLIAQDDTFFRVPAGRLKLREFADGSAELIHYHRADTDAAKASDYVRVAVPEPAALREALARACGLIGRVRKQRWLLLVREAGFTTRIHLDRVEQLGDFMELEVVLQDSQTDAQGQAVAEALMQRLGLAAAPRLAGAYMDMLAASAAGRAPAR